ncbi:HlyD family efflux transporter periplasmic adaptor subunit [Magnetovirga frankeli]|uniref:efflux RND transporter periplasmic adaptor subunit n=1 Tax=Magnetovirga frankeli TaxID=947516 RepID=UPI0012935316|nr:HlyD family efflux transporter periplasmic adaptor subunit [gamma proteobacterium SS-5]
MKILKFLRPLLILALAGGLGFFIIKGKPTPKPVEVKEKAWPVRVQLAEPATLAPTLTLYGRIESLWSSQLTAGIAADVLQVAVLEGDEVAKGDLLLQLDERDARLLLAQREAELAEARARIRSAESRHQSNQENLPREQQLYALTEKEVQRLQDLAEQQMAAQSALDKAIQDLQRQAINLRGREQAISEFEATRAELEARLSRAQALRDQAQLELERCRVSAPFAGRIAKVLVSPGKRVRLGDPLVELYDLEAMVVRAQLPSRHIAQIKQALDRGQRLQISGEVDGQPLRARLLRIAGEVSSASGGVEALFAIDQGEQFQQGRFVRIDLGLPERHNLLAVPAEAIYGTDRLYRLAAEQRLQPVQARRVGERRLANGLTQVLIESEQIQPGDMLVTTQLPNAVEGLLVAPSDAEGNPLVQIRSSEKAE